MEKLRDATLLFLIRRSQGRVAEICLAMKKRGFGVNRWNGVGGKIKGDETIREAAVREAREEIGVEIKRMDKIAELSFYFPHNPLWDQLVHVYFCDEWRGEPAESEEMNPRWFSADRLPFTDMWPDDEFWVPHVLKGNLLKGMFKFAEGDVILDKKVDIVKEL